MNKKKILILTSFLAFVSLGLPDGLLGVAWPYISEKVSVGLDQLGVLLLSFLGGYLLTSSANSYILKKISLGTLLLLSCFLTAFSIFGFVVLEHWYGIIIASFFLGAGGGAIDTSINIYASAKFSASVVNWLHAFYGVGATSGPFLFSWLLVYGKDWYWGYVLVGSIQFLIALVFIGTQKLWVLQDEAEKEQSESITLMDSIKIPWVWLIMLIFFCYTGLEVSVGQWSYSVLITARNVLEATAGFWVTVYWASLTAGRIFFGFVLKKITPIPLLLGVLIGVVVGALLLFLDVSNTLSIFGIFCMGFFLAPVFPSLISLVQTYFGAQHAPNIIGFLIAAAMIGGAVLPASLGFIAQEEGLGSLSLAFLVLSFAVLFFFIALSRKKSV